MCSSLFGGKNVSYASISCRALPYSMLYINKYNIVRGSYCSARGGLHVAPEATSLKRVQYLLIETHARVASRTHMRDPVNGR